MLLIGLTGQSGAGKGAFCRILKERYGIDSIDADAVYHDLLIPPSPCLDALAAEFGTEILRPDGTLDRKALAAIVFSPEDAEVRASRIRTLNGLTHYFVLNKTDEMLRDEEKAGTRVMIFDAPALYESGADKWCDLLVAVTADAETRIARIIARDGLTREAAEQRVRGQHPEEYYTERAHAVLRNDGTVEEFARAVEAFYETHLAPRLTAK